MICHFVAILSEKTTHDNHFHFFFIPRSIAENGRSNDYYGERVIMQIMVQTMKKEQKL